MPVISNHRSIYLDEVCHTSEVTLMTRSSFLEDVVKIIQYTHTAILTLTDIVLPHRSADHRYVVPLTVDTAHSPAMNGLKYNKTSTLCQSNGASYTPVNILVLQ